MPLSPSLRAAAAALLGALGAVACSGASHGLSESAACSALDACCASLGGAEASSCHSTVTSATDAQCSAALSSLVQAGGCTGVSYDGGVGDSGLPCTVTGTCPGSSSSSGGTSSTGSGGSGSSSGGAGPQCVPSGACQDGTTYETCTETSASGTCAAAVVFTDGTTYPCVSCTNCAAASVSAVGHCGTVTPVPEAGPVCTAAPTLHAETVAGVYCPFTTAGAIHCASAQECCETPSTVTNGSTCQAVGAVCPVAGSLAWGCNGPVDCVGNAAGPVCCGAGSVTLDPTCGFERGSGFAGTHCASSCAAGEETVCAATTDPCPGGTACTPFKVAGIDLGACL